MSAQSLMHSHCLKGCCSIITRPYTRQNYTYRHKYKKSKAGVFFHDLEKNKILLVQSCGEKWGPPKGTMEEYDQTIEDCAVREVQEETGITVNKENLTNKHRIDRATYYYLPYTSSDITPPSNEDGNDASGITWIHPGCLKEMHDCGEMDLNAHCKKLVGKLLKIPIVKK